MVSSASLWSHIQESCEWFSSSSFDRFQVFAAPLYQIFVYIVVILLYLIWTTNQHWRFLHWKHRELLMQTSWIIYCSVFSIFFLNLIRTFSPNCWFRVVCPHAHNMSIICEELIEKNDLHNQLDKYLATVKGHKITNDNASVILNYFDKLRAILTNSLLRNQDLTGRLRQQSELVELINSVRTTKTTTSTDKSVNAVSSNDHTSNNCLTVDPPTIATDSPISQTAANHSNTSSTYSLETIRKAFTTQELPDYIVRFLRSFLSNWSVLLNHPISPITCKIVHGVPQGSSTGPFLWNLVINEFLKFDFPDNICPTAYADDVTFVLSGKSCRQLEFLGESSLRILDNWCTRSLNISLEKTKILYLFKTAKLQRKYIKLRQKKIQEVSQLNILGCIFDQHLNWCAHALHLRLVSKSLHTQLRKMTGTTWGIKSKHLKLWYKTVVERIILYAAPVWGSQLQSKVKSSLLSIQRLFALAISKLL